MLFGMSRTILTRTLWRVFTSKFSPPASTQAPFLAVADVPSDLRTNGHQGQGGPLGVVQGLKEALEGLWLMAVPKKKISVARRAVRNAPKALQWDHSVQVCVKCGLPRRPHTYCEKFNCGKLDAESGTVDTTGVDSKQP